MTQDGQFRILLKCYGFTPTSSFAYIDGKGNLFDRAALRDLFDLHDPASSDGSAPIPTPSHLVGTTASCP